MNQQFGKEYKLCSQKIIDTIFIEKKSVKAYPFVLSFLETPLSNRSPFQLTVSVPKRIFKKAHDRNRIKRLMRECIRKNKLNLEPFLTDNDKQVALFMIYTAREELSIELLQKKTKQLFKQLIDELSKESKSN
jgi:ribonuclease P protein component